MTFHMGRKVTHIEGNASSQRDTETAAIVELIRLDQMPTPDDLRQGQFKQIYPVLLGGRPANSN